MKEIGNPLAFWFLNHDLDDEELRWQLGEMKAKGFEGIFIHPRSGLRVPYLSDLWFEKVRIIVDHCRKIGLQTWLYDEDPYPSGTAGGRVFLDHPEFVARGLNMHQIKTLGGRVREDVPVGRLLRAVAIPIHDGVHSSDHSVDVTDSMGLVRENWSEPYVNHSNYYPPYNDFGSPHWRSATYEPFYRLDCNLPKGTWEIFIFIEREENQESIWGGHADLLNPEAVRYFMKLTHEKYARLFKEDFNDVILGIFTDEPKARGEMPWTPRLPDLFYDQFGYDIETMLPHLFTTIDKRTAQVRHDYRYAVSKLIEGSFMKQIADWCKEQGLIFTGHISPEEDPIGMTKWTPYLLSLLQRFELPGTDLIGGHYGGEERPLLHIGPKIASSAAHHTGRNSVLVEAFGANSWKLDFSTMKRMTDWLFVLGVTNLTTHGAAYSIEGPRKKEAPPSYFYQSSHWPYFGYLSDYIKTLGNSLSEGTHDCRLLVYYPQASFSALMPDKMAAVEQLRDRFGTIIHRLLEQQWDFDFVDEDTLLQFKATEDGKIRGPHQTYDVLLFPYCDYVESAAAELCRSIVDEGANVWVLEKEPELLYSPGKTETTQTASRFWSKTVTDEGLWSELISHVERNIVLYDEENELLSETDEINDGMRDVYMQVREVEKKLRIFLVNAAGRWRKGLIENRVTGKRHRFSLPPYGSLLGDFDIQGVSWQNLQHVNSSEVDSAYWNEMFGEKKLELSNGSDHSKRVKSSEITDLSRDWLVTPKGDNAIVLSHWHFWQGKPNTHRAPFTSTASVNVMNDNGGFADIESFGFNRFYTSGVPKSPVTLVFEPEAWSGEAKVTVNGHVLPQPFPSRRFDVNNLEVDITSYLLTGPTVQLNQIEIYFPFGGKLHEPFRIYGRFIATFPYEGYPPAHLHLNDAEVHMKELSSWDDVGFPHHAGTVIYEKQFMVAEDWLKTMPTTNEDMVSKVQETIWLQIEAVQDVARLIVNDEVIAVQFSQPFAWEVAKALRPGKNKIVLEVANSSVTLYEGVRKKAGIQGPIQLVHYSI